MLARISRFLGPWGWLGLGVGATVGAVELAGGMAREGRQEAMAFLELNRALGLDYPTWVGFLDVARGRPFATRAELEALFYTARDAGQFAASYGIVSLSGGGPRPSGWKGYSGTSWRASASPASSGPMRGASPPCCASGSRRGP
ncbi:hypothetical protein [Thermus antranikianii]|uniref:hypothetical protein n=1 Tax=Thermus antranikianii TaxID=88190 RepID=UPI001C77B108|nr:hypothetical protein [Thermus antranikianii]QWK20785.1 MAG: hypothetical protein KNN15_06830 [Thermus antranikianii]